MVKRRRVARFDAALVGGPRHRHYLTRLGMPPDRVALGYNAVDNDYFASEARRAHQSPAGRSGLPRVPYFLTVCRYVPEKNLIGLVRAFAHYRDQCDIRTAWDLVICGDGLGVANVNAAVSESGCAGAIHQPGFLQVHELPRFTRMPVRSCCRAFQNPGAWSQTKPPPAACR